MDDLVVKGVVCKNVLVKVLGDGKLIVKVDVFVYKFSGSVCVKIIVVGGLVIEF